MPSSVEAQSLNYCATRGVAQIYILKLGICYFPSCFISNSLFLFHFDAFVIICFPWRGWGFPKNLETLVFDCGPGCQMAERENVDVGRDEGLRFTGSEPCLDVSHLCLTRNLMICASSICWMLGLRKESSWEIFIRGFQCFNDARVLISLWRWVLEAWVAASQDWRTVTGNKPWSICLNFLSKWAFKTFSRCFLSGPPSK